MEHIKLFEEFGILDYFKKKNSNPKPSSNGPSYLPKPSGNEGPPMMVVSGVNYKMFNKLNVFIDTEPYESSQFGQEKYSVYVSGNSTDLYYIGDIRKWPNTDSYLSYLRFDKIKKVNRIRIEPIEGKAKELVEKELDKIYIASDLMDDDITNRDYLKKLLNSNG